MLQLLQSKRFWTFALFASLALALLSLFPILIHLAHGEPSLIKPKNAGGFAIWSVFALASWRRWRAFA